MIIWHIQSSSVNKLQNVKQKWSCLPLYDNITFKPTTPTSNTTVVSNTYDNLVNSVKKRTSLE